MDLCYKGFFLKKKVIPREVEPSSWSVPSCYANLTPSPHRLFFRNLILQRSLSLSDSLDVTLTLLIMMTHV